MMQLDVMPTIAEDGAGDPDSLYNGDDSQSNVATANFEQLMVSMLDERDKLMETLREAQEQAAIAQAKVGELEREKNAVQRQLEASVPQVSALL